jgi:hypothetical protein
MERRLELKAELTRRDMKYRELAALLRERGFDVGEFHIASLVAGRMTPSEKMRRAVSEILGRPTFEIFHEGVKA